MITFNSIFIILICDVLKSSAFLPKCNPSHFISRNGFQNRDSYVPKTAFTVANLSSEDQQQKSLSDVEKITEMIDTTFVNACMQLAQGYVDVLKLFIVSVKSGYELGVIPSELIETVDAVPNKAAGRDLMMEEIELRNTWIQIIYFVLNDTKHNSKSQEIGSSIDTEVISSFKPKLEALQKRKKDGKTFNVDSIIDNSAEIDPLKSAILAQSLRVIWYTLVVLEEEERCQTEFSRPDAPMKPQIPGAF